MSLESGKKSAEQLRQEQRDMISKAEAVQPTVAVMEPNWKAMIDSQKAQVKTLGEILEKFDTLTTEERLRAHMDMQLQILRSDGKASVEVMEQYRQTLTLEVKAATLQLKDLARELEKQVGKTSGEFGKAILQEQERIRSTSKKLFWISMIPSLILVVWELTRHIWLLGCWISSTTVLSRTAPQSIIDQSAKSPMVNPWAECKLKIQGGVPGNQHPALIFDTIANHTRIKYSTPMCARPIHK